jgi:hypothetical protein
MVDHILTPRQQRAIESVLEDESLTADLKDDQAAVLIRWAGEQARVAAAPDYSDVEMAEAVRSIRVTVRRVAREAGEGTDPQQLIAAAAALLASQAPSLVAAKLHPDATITRPPAVDRPAAPVQLIRRRISLTSYRVV